MSISILSRLLAWMLLAIAAVPIPAKSTQPMPAGVARLLQQHYPNHRLSDVSGWGDDAQGRWALVVSQDEHHVLLVAQKEHGEAAYRFTVENPNALMSGDTQPSAILDVDGESLFFGFRDTDHDWSFHAVYRNGAWGDVDLIRYRLPLESHLYPSISLEESLLVKDGLLYYHTAVTDENDHQGVRLFYPPIPVPHMAGRMLLPRFDWQLFPLRPTDLVSTIGGPHPDTLAALTPQGWRIQQADITPGGIFLLGLDHEGQTRLLLKHWKAQEWTHGMYIDTVSAPLPDAAWFKAYMGVDVHLSARGPGYSFIRPEGSDRWRLQFVMGDNRGEDWFYVGPDYLFDPQAPEPVYHFGDIPWTDIASLTFQALPRTFAQAREHLDQDGWAKANPAAKSMPLLDAPDVRAQTLVMLYRGTPLRVLERTGNWARVQLAGLSGWVQADALALGEDMNGVRPAFPPLMGADSTQGRPMPLHERPDAASPAPRQRDLKDDRYYWIVAEVEDDWYYVYFFPEGIGGYMPQAWFRSWLTD